MILCEYGCGQEAKYQFKNGKWCCSEYTSKCPIINKKNTSKLGMKDSEETKNKRRKSLKGKISWNKGLTKETDERVKKSSEKMIGLNNPNYGKKLSIKNRLKQSQLVIGKNNPNYGNFGELNPNWKGGDIGWCHTTARRLFGQDTCEVCGMTNEEHLKKTNKSLHMHCDGKRYRNMERIFWTTCCIWCHKKIEALDKEG